MTEQESKIKESEAKKEKIRQRYKGINVDELDVIPAVKEENFYDDKTEKRVAVYARVSTDDPNQTSSFELQKNHYEDVVTRHPGWNLTEIYADEGISGTSLKHRDSFNRMIDDCKAGKIDMIITKSVSRFARNVLDCIGEVRALAAMNPPIGVFFETEGIYTLDPKSEMSLSFIATLAQEESHNKSEIMNASIEMRNRRGLFLVQPLLGYDKDDDGNLIVNQSEVPIVRLIFFLYLYGYKCQYIADKLTELGCKTKKGNTRWSASSVVSVLRNEKHCGDVLARKTYTPNYLDHKSKKNRKNRNQYRQRDHHEPIISRDDFIAVQHMLDNAKYGNKGYLPQLKVVTEGVLKGFVSVNPRWAGFKSSDYINASESVVNNASTDENIIRLNHGDFDLRGFEVARGQFFDILNKISITFSSKLITFSTKCVRKLDSQYIEILVNPTEKLLAIRPVPKDYKNAMQWSKKNNGSTVPKPIGGAAFLPNLFDLFGWKENCKYKLLGTKIYGSDSSILIFDLNETEVLIPNYVIDPSSKDSKSVSVFPESLIKTFGNEFYDDEGINNNYYGNIIESETEYSSTPALNITPNIPKEIDSIISVIKKEAVNE